jgi:hypothetical protein
MPYLDVCCLNPFQEAAGGKSKHLCIATNVPWYAGNKQIQEDLKVLFFTKQIQIVIVLTLS